MDSAGFRGAAWRRHNRVVLAAIASALCAVSSTARADLTISAQKSHDISCAAGTCTATASSAVLNVRQLRRMLSSSSVTVVSGSLAESIDVDAAVTWASTKRLTLDAAQSIVFRQPLSVAGGGALDLLTNDGESGGSLVFAGAGTVSFLNLVGALTIDGEPYALVGDVDTLASEIAAQPKANVALAADYDASSKHYAQAPVTTTFAGSFEGLGHTISNLQIFDMSQTWDGLFAFLNIRSSVENLHLANVSISSSNPSGNSRAGALAAFNMGSVARVSATGAVSGDSRFFGFDGGGLVGVNYGHITSASINVLVSGGNDAQVGGLAGNNHGKISASSATGNVSAYERAYEGGLVGYNIGRADISASWASGAVSGQGGLIGGLLGSNNGGAVTGSLASGAVQGQVLYNFAAGGLIAENDAGEISHCYATGAVAGRTWVGGLVGYTAGPIWQSFATGSVTAATKADVGGLVGLTDGVAGGGRQGEVRASYATGSVTGGSQSNAGGLVGLNWSGGAIGASYSTGAVSGTTVGGSIGNNASDSLHHIYWDTTTSGIASPGIGNEPGAKGVSPLTTTQLQSMLPSGFSPAIWTEDSSKNNGLPYLIENPPPS